jgi:hypothetical protein
METTLELTNLEDRAAKAMSPIMERALAYQVVDEVTYLDADVVIREIRRLVAEREKELLPPKEAATRAWKAMCALVKKYIDDPLEACKTLDRKRYGWKKLEDKRRADEAEAARKAEQRRLDDEKLKLAERLEGVGMNEQAKAVLDSPVAASEVQAVKVAVAEGQVNVENWQAIIVTPDLVPREFCSPDPVKLGRYAKLMKSAGAVAGVRFEDIGTVRRAK